MPKTVIQPIEPPTLTAEQIDTILDRIVPLIADPADHGFFRGVLRITAEQMNSANFAVFVKGLLDKAGAAPTTIDTVPPLS